MWGPPGSVFLPHWFCHSELYTWVCCCLEEHVFLLCMGGGWGAREGGGLCWYRDVPLWGKGGWGEGHTNSELLEWLRKFNYYKDFINSKLLAIFTILQQSKTYCTDICSAKIRQTGNIQESQLYRTWYAEILIKKYEYMFLYILYSEFFLLNVQDILVTCHYFHP